MQFTYDTDMFVKTFESEFTWLNGFMRNVRRFGNRTAVIDPAHNIKWTYTELNTAANKFANAMKADGVKKGDVVFMQLFNSTQFLLGYISPQKLGAIGNPVNFNLSPGETAEIIGHNKPTVYVYDTEILDTVVKALEITSHTPKVIIAVNNSGKEIELPQGHILFEDYIKNASEENPPVDFEPHIYDEVVRLQTSGTTGTPKGVPLNNVNEVLSAHDVIMHFPLNPTDITMNMTPWFHRGGLHSGGPTPTLYVGGCIVILRNFNPKTCLEYVESNKITFITGVPSILTLLASRQEKHPKNISSLKGIITMGSPLEKEACIRFQNVLTPNIFNGYGTTETFWNTFLRPYDLPEMAGSAGRSCTDDEVRIVNVYDKGDFLQIKPYSRRINYYETDMMSIVHHSNYIRFFEEARCDFMEQIGCDVRALEDKGVSIAVVDAYAKYIVPLKFDDKVYITTKLTKMSAAKMEFEYEIRFADTDILATTGRTTHCCVNRSNKPMPIKKADANLYETLQNLI